MNLAPWTRVWINPDSRFHDLSLFSDYCLPA